MRKKVISAVAATAIVLTMSVSAFAAVRSPQGHVEVKDSETGTTETVTITTTTDTIRDAAGNTVAVDNAETPTIKITTTSQASAANAAAGANASAGTLTDTSLTVAENEKLIAENAKTANAANTTQALDAIDSDLAKQTETTLKTQGMDNNLNSYNQAATLDVSFDKKAKDLAAKNGGITMTMKVDGAKEGTKGFVQYYDENGKAHIIPVTFGKNGMVSFKLPNASVIRIFIQAQAV